MESAAPYAEAGGSAFLRVAAVQEGSALRHHHRAPVVNVAGRACCKVAGEHVGTGEGEGSAFRIVQRAACRGGRIVRKGAVLDGDVAAAVVQRAAEDARVAFEDAFFHAHGTAPARDGKRAAAVTGGDVRLRPVVVEGGISDGKAPAFFHDGRNRARNGALRVGLRAVAGKLGPVDDDTALVRAQAAEGTRTFGKAAVQGQIALVEHNGAFGVFPRAADKANAGQGNLGFFVDDEAVVQPDVGIVGEGHAAALDGAGECALHLQVFPAFRAHADNGKPVVRPLKADESVDAAFVRQLHGGAVGTRDEHGGAVSVRLDGAGVEENLVVAFRAHALAGDEHAGAAVARLNGAAVRNLAADGLPAVMHTDAVRTFCGDDAGIHHGLVRGTGVVRHAAASAYRNDADVQSRAAGIDAHALACAGHGFTDINVALVQDGVIFAGGSPHALGVAVHDPDVAVVEPRDAGAAGHGHGAFRLRGGVFAADKDILLPGDVVIPAVVRFIYGGVERGGRFLIGVRRQGGSGSAQREHGRRSKRAEGVHESALVQYCFVTIDKIFYGAFRLHDFFL